MRPGMRLTKAANEALDLYVEYMECEVDEIDNEERRWQFMDEAVEILQAMAGRKVSDEIVH